MNNINAINKIVLFTDFSEVSQNATQYALNISKSTNAEIEILHVINTSVDWVNLPLENEKLYPEVKLEVGRAKEKLSALQVKFLEKGVKATESLVFNVGVENIPQYIKPEKQDLIIMGSHGSKGIKEFTIGSNTQKVIRNSEVPVLVVKSPPQSNFFNHIVMTSTFEENLKPYFKKMLNYATGLSSDIDLLYINTPYRFKETEEIEKTLALVCEDSSQKKCRKQYIDALNEEKGIDFFMRNSNADLLAIVTRKKTKLSSLFSSSLSESIITDLNIPVLVFHNN